MQIVPCFWAEQQNRCNYASGVAWRFCQRTSAAAYRCNAARFSPSRRHHPSPFRGRNPSQQMTRGPSAVTIGELFVGASEHFKNAHVLPSIITAFNPKRSAHAAGKRSLAKQEFVRSNERLGLKWTLFEKRRSTTETLTDLEKVFASDDINCSAPF